MPRAEPENSFAPAVGGAETHISSASRPRARLAVPQRSIIRMIRMGLQRNFRNWKKAQRKSQKPSH